MTDDEMRLEALRLANQFADLPDTTVARAEVYFAFLSGRAPVSDVTDVK